MKVRRAHLFAALTATTVVVACTLNPQPLPPEEAVPADGGLRAPRDAAAPSFDPSAASADAASPAPNSGEPTADADAAPNEANADGGDGGPDGGEEDGG